MIAPSVLRVFLGLAVVASLAACAMMASPPRETYYRLPPAPAAVPAPAPSLEAALEPLLEVPPFVADGVLGERPLVFVHADGTTLEQQVYHLWVDSPRLLLQEALLDALRAEGVGPLTASASATSRYIVNARVVRFERRSDAARGVAAVELAFDVARTADGASIFERRYQSETALSDADMATAAAALGRAARMLVAEFARDLRASLAR